MRDLPDYGRHVSNGGPVEFRAIDHEKSTERQREASILESER
jgi:hypothetical protein